MHCMLLLYVIVCFFAQFHCNDIALKITTHFIDDVHFLHAFNLNFTITLISYTFQLRQHSASPSCALIITINVLTIALAVYCVLALIPAEHFNRTHFR